jgi:hypothetical protein
VVIMIVAIIQDMPLLSPYVNAHFGGASFLFSSFFTLKMEVICSSETSVHIQSGYLKFACCWI